MNNADMASVLLRGAGMFSENLQRLHRNESMAYTEEAFFALAAELDKSATPQKMPGVLDIPGVKDYVNATPPVPDSSTTSDAREQSVSGGSGPAAGLCEHDWDAGFIGPVSGTHQRKCLKCGAWKDPTPTAPSTDAALTVAMKWLEIQSGYVAGKKGYVMPWETQATAILSHIRQQAGRISDLTQQVRNLENANTRNYNRQLADDKERDALRARVAELEAEKERDEVSDWMRACAAQAERIAELEGSNAALVVDRQHYIERLAAADKAAARERDILNACSRQLDDLIREHNTLKKDAAETEAEFGVQNDELARTQLERDQLLKSFHLARDERDTLRRWKNNTAIPAMRNGQEWALDEAVRKAPADPSEAS